MSTTITGTDWGVAVITPMEQYRPPGAGHSGITATKSFARKQPGFTPGSGQEAEDVRCSGPARFARIREALFSDAAFAGCITAMADLQ
jgi:hypothetical protein